MAEYIERSVAIAKLTALEDGRCKTSAGRYSCCRCGAGSPWSVD